MIQGSTPWAATTGPVVLIGNMSGLYPVDVGSNPTWASIKDFIMRIEPIKRILKITFDPKRRKKLCQKVKTKKNGKKVDIYV